LGWNASFAAHLGSYADRGGSPARVIVEHRDQYGLVTERGEIDAVLCGRLRSEVAGAERPTVGDWVVARAQSGADTAMVDTVLPRHSAFVRAAAGTGGGPQIVAANVDTVFVVDAIDRAPNLRRIERYLVLAWESGAVPVVVLSKADASADSAGALLAVQAVASDADVVTTSAFTGDGLADLERFLRPARTVALLGPSGVGKSTLVNHFLGQATQTVRDVRARDGKGRHTTTRRQLVRTPSGALLLDTPGMRELHVWDAEYGLERTFADVEALARGCRFADCRHEGEPGCAVLAAVAAGTVPAERLANHRKLQRELAQTEARRDQRAAAEANRRGKVAAKAYDAEVKRRGY